MRSPLHSSRAIVLSTEDFGEADRYIQFLTQRWGLVSLLAKSARKSKRRFVGGMDLFCHDEIFLKSEPKERALLLELKVLNSFPAIREDLDRVTVAGKIAQWVKKLVPPATPIPITFSLLGQTLALIEKEENPTRLELLALIFKMKLLAELGLKPRVDGCVKCESSSDDRDYAFDFGSGGIVCAPCRPNHRILDASPLDSGSRLFIDKAPELKLTQWEQISLDEKRTQYLTRLVTQFASFHTHVKLPS